MSVPMKQLPPIEYLRERFALDVDAGLLRWRRREGVHESWNTKYVDKIAGDPQANGRMRVGLDDQRYLVHRIIFKMFYGYEPPEIDHEDTDYTNNRPGNLRPCDHGSNIANGRRRRKQSGLPKGVVLKGGRYYVAVRKHGVSNYVGYFDDVETAHVAYCAAADKFHGEFARHD
jgi:hypothetical protein